MSSAAHVPPTALVSVGLVIAVVAERRASMLCERSAKHTGGVLERLGASAAFVAGESPRLSLFLIKLRGERLHARPHEPLRLRGSMVHEG